MSAADTAAARAAPCPICGKPAEPEFRPFCSRRCSEIDLHRWLTGAYAIPVPDDEPDDETPSERPEG